MAEEQEKLDLPEPPDEAAENEQDREKRLHVILMRRIDEAVSEVGAQNVCYALNISEPELSKQRREAEGREPKARLLAYLVKHQKSGRLATWLMRDYADYLPPQKPEQLEPEEFVRAVLSLALAGEFGNAGREKVVGLYARVKR